MSSFSAFSANGSNSRTSNKFPLSLSSRGESNSDGVELFTPLANSSSPFDNGMVSRSLSSGEKKVFFPTESVSQQVQNKKAEMDTRTPVQNKLTRATEGLTVPLLGKDESLIDIPAALRPEGIDRDDPLIQEGSCCQKFLCCTGGVAIVGSLIGYAVSITSGYGYLPPAGFLIPVAAGLGCGVVSLVSGSILGCCQHAKINRENETASESRGVL